MCADTIVLDVTCMGCYQAIETPSDADMELFRMGFRIHDDDNCYQLMLTNVGIGDSDQ